MTYCITEQQLQEAVNKRYQKQSNEVTINERVYPLNHQNPSDSNPNGYFTRLAKLANQVDAERAAQEAIRKGFEPIDFHTLAKLEVLFSKPENQNKVSYGEYKAVLDAFIKRYGKNPSIQQVKGMIKEQKTADIKKLERLL